MSYVELLCKSNFSFLTGASHPEELIQTALQSGLAGIALADRNGVYGIAKAFKEARQFPQFKYIVGSEFVFSDHPEITLLAKNISGYGKITQLLTLAHQGKEKGGAQLSFDQFHEFFEDQDSSGLTCLLRLEPNLAIERLKHIFDRNCHLALTRYLDGRDSERTEKCYQLKKNFGLSLFASNDVYYHNKDRKMIQDVLICIREGKSLSEAGAKLFPNGERYLKSYPQMQKLYSDVPETLLSTLAIAEECRFCLSELRYIYPSEWIPPNHNAQSYLEELVKIHAPRVYKNEIPENVSRQVAHELSLIQQLGYADYFLTIYDIVCFARSQDILCQGRGSAANSVICYILGITAIDPVQMNLLFERFISAERNEPPDIDVDFEHERREEVIQYIYKKYGRHRAAMVSAVITYRRRSALRDVEKVFQGLDQSRVASICETIKGFPRHLSIHSGGFTLSAQPITQIVPVEPARMPGRTIVQWDKYDLDILGLLKVDVLSLGMLSALKKTLKMVRKELHEIPHDDPATYNMIQRRETVGTFQIESRAQMQMLGRLKPKNFYELVIEIAIVRPGPIIGQMVHPYLKRKNGLEKISFPNEKVERILGKTLGIPLFQEQVMRLAIELAHFTPGEADKLRRSINSWRSSAPMSEMGNRLRTGLIKSGLSEEFANQIFQQIQGFSEYGFPESHAASFALLAYASCYLKCHHPAEFACSLINSQPLGFYRNDTILYEALRNGVHLLPVCINNSNWDCHIESPQTIRLGFRLLKGLSQVHVEDLISERKKQLFKNIHDLIRRTNLPQKALGILAMAGRFQDFQFEPREALWALLEYDNMISKNHSGQLSLFQQTDWGTSQESFSELSDFEKIKYDYEGFSLSTQGHPMLALRKSLRHLPKNTSADLKELRPGSSVQIAGLTLIRQRPPTAKGVVFATLEDEFGFIDIIIHPKVFEKYKDVILQNCFISIEGTLQKEGNTISLITKRVKPISGGIFIEPTQYF